MSAPIAEMTLKDLLKRSVKKKLLTFQQSDYLFHENQRAKSIFFLKSGKVKIMKNEGTEHKVVLHIANAGEILGIHPVVNRQPYTTSAIALARTTAYSVPATEFRHIVRDEAGLKLMIMKHLCVKIDLLENQMSRTGKKSTSQRLADAIVSLAKEHGLDGDNYLKLELESGDLAEIIGTSKEYLAKRIHDFCTDGLISFKSGRIKIRDLAGLEKAAGSKVPAA
jgi:CRP-like cAMP-binding protein